MQEIDIFNSKSNIKQMHNNRRNELPVDPFTNINLKNYYVDSGFLSAPITGTDTIALIALNQS